MEYAVATGVSLVTEIVKRYFGTSTLGTYLTFAAVSVLIGGAYVALQGTPQWEIVVRIAVQAAGIYGLLIKQVVK